MSWIDTIVVTLVVAVGLFILYRPLKEPIDAFFGLLKRGALWVIDMVRGTTVGQVEEIRYG